MPTLTGVSWFLLGAAVLHAAFMLCELFPWSCPVLLKRVIEKKLAGKIPFTKEDQLRLVATIVHNAGIYNALLAGGLFWAAFHGVAAADTARVLLSGAALAGVFGTVTLRSPYPAVQALVGIVGFFLV